jgi:hypothetical protein
MQIKRQKGKTVLRTVFPFCSDRQLHNQKVGSRNTPLSGFDVPKHRALLAKLDNQLLEILSIPLQLQQYYAM